MGESGIEMVIGEKKSINTNNKRDSCLRQERNTIKREHIYLVLTLALL